MEIHGKTIIITGAASGIGLAMAQRFKTEGAKALILADLNADGVTAAGRALDALAVPTDVGDEAQIKALVAAAEAARVLGDGVEVVLRAARRLGLEDLRAEAETLEADPWNDGGASIEVH